MDPGYSIRHRATRRGLRVVLDLTATGDRHSLACVAGRAVDEIRALLARPDVEAYDRPDRGRDSGGR